MKDVALGDLVLTDTNPETYERIYNFGHYDKSALASFLQIHTTDRRSNNVPLEMTGEHLVFVERHNRRLSAVRADTVQVGDAMSTGGGATIVTKLSSVEKKGLYMPLTPSGKIVVDGILASSYVSISEHAPNVVNHPLIHGWLSEDALLHLYLSPYRLYCMGLAPHGCQLPENGIIPYLQWGQQLAEFGNEQTFGMQIVMGILLLAIFGSIYLVEAFIGPSMVPTLLLFIGASWWMRRQRRSEKAKLT